MKGFLLEESEMNRHLIFQKNEFSRIEAPTNDFYLITINLNMLIHYPNWNWNLNNLHYRNNLENAINITDFSNIEYEQLLLL